MLVGLYDGARRHPARPHLRDVAGPPWFPRRVESGTERSAGDQPSGDQVPDEHVARAREDLDQGTRRLVSPDDRPERARACRDVSDLRADWGSLRSFRTLTAA